MKIGNLAGQYTLISSAAAALSCLLFNRRTTEMFRNINHRVKKRLLNIYKFDFLLFSYSWQKYF